jgi:RNA polymerase sigma factor (sigma-70 family)
MAVSDAKLMRVALDDPAVFGELFERHFDAVYRFCERRVGRAGAEDLAGETFRRAFEARGSYDFEQASALPWLYRIALNLVRDEARSRAAQDRAYAHLHALAAVNTSDGVGGEALAALEARDELALVARLLVSLPEDDVEALFRHVWDDLSYSEVAVALGVPVGTVRSRLSRLRRRLAVLLAEANRCPGETRTGTGGH